MKKLIGVIILLFFGYFLFELTFTYFQGGHKIKYYINDGSHSIEVSEHLRSGNKSDDDNYSINFVIDEDITFNVQTFYNFNRSSNIIKDVKYYNDDSYNCIFIKYRNNRILNDVICKKDDIMYNYNSIKSPSSELSQFVDSLSELGYIKEEWIDPTTNVEKTDNAEVYKDNIVENYYVGISNGTTFYQVNSNVTMRKNNLYNTELMPDKMKNRAFINEYYMTYNYNSINETKFNYYDVTSNESHSIERKDLILSNETYALGTYKTSLYVYDPISKKEYEVDYDNENILEVGNEQTGIKCYDMGEWKFKNIDDDLYFKTGYKNDYTDSNYDKIIKIGNKYGYYYLFKKLNDKYSVYRMDVTNKNEKLYLFDTTSADKIVFINDYVYYIENGNLKYYSDTTGNRTLIYSEEIFRNDNTLFSVVYKKND